MASYWRVLRTLALVVAFVVLTLSVVTSVTAARDKQAVALDNELSVTLSKQTGDMEDYFERSRGIASLLADNPVFTDFYRAPGGDQEKIRRGGPLITRVNTALAYLERLYPGRIGEACFIDASGVEIARVVHGTPAAPDDLSVDEADNAFFGATLALPTGTVHQALVYVSPDTGDRVVSNSLTVSAAGRTGIVHYEITLDSFRMAESAVGKGIAATIVDAATGGILLDSRTGEPVGAAPGGTAQRGRWDVTTGGRQAGTTTVGGRRIAYQRLTPTPGNANDWYVVVSAPEFGGGWARGLSVGSLVLMIGALLTIAVSGAGLRSYHLSVRHTALHDPLTGLPNRVLLGERLEQALRADRRSGTATGVLMVDLNRFKEVNDMLGHQHGDLLLKEVARRLTAVVRSRDTVARLGGDEFAVVMPSVSGVDDVELVAGRLLASLHDSFMINGVTLDVEAGIGLAVSPDHGSEPAELLRHADAAMFVAKDRSGGYVRYDPEQQHAPTRLALLGDLRRALAADDQLVLHYQPKVDIAHHTLIGVEALIRWRHPERGMLAPDTFIPVAESTALIQRLTERVLDISMAQASTWLSQGLHVPVAVNLSTRSLLDFAFPDSVLACLARHGVPASLLHLEITESTVMADPDRALGVLRALRAAGIRLSVDDFGTGHSSLSYLKQLPVDEIKIDRSFVMGMTRDTDDAVLVRSAIDLGHNLGLAVVAEGVEDEEALDALRDLGCDIAQGYHLGRPVPAEQLQDWLLTADRQSDPDLDDARVA